MLKSRRIGFSKDKELGAARDQWYVKNLYRRLWNHYLYVISDINQGIAIDLRLIYDARVVTRSVRSAYLYIHRDAVSVVSNYRLSWIAYYSGFKFLSAKAIKHLTNLVRDLRDDFYAGAKEKRARWLFGNH